MKALICRVVSLAVTAAAAADRLELQAPPPVGPFSDARVPMPLLPRQQSHCGYFNGNFVCADRCGTDYQVYSCPNSAGGCCHPGLGYCDAGGRLRCGVPWF